MVDYAPERLTGPANRKHGLQCADETKETLLCENGRPNDAADR